MSAHPPAFAARRSATTADRPTADGGCGCHPAACSCPVCEGLHTFVRPRFFAGQTLTDADLTALSTYVVEKQQLHNRYLHGPGVVCGLQVECDECGPGVIVRPGYALDPCGADIVSAEAVRLDIAALAARCTPAHRAADCDPPRYPSATGCDDVEQVWCLWVAYKEQQDRAVSPLGAGAARANGCGKGGGCGCGGTVATSGAPNGSRSSACGCTPAPRQTSAPASCEPSRVREYLEFGVAPKDEHCGTLEGALGGTFPMKVLECIRHVQPLLTNRMSPKMQRSAFSLATGGQVSRSPEAHDAVCQLYANIVDLYRKDPLGALCTLPEELSSIDCSPRKERETTAQFRARMTTAAQQLVLLVVLYLRDCVCAAALPPCPPGVTDNRVVLACVTLRRGVVVSICNLACRRYAGSFVNREYWLPIGPVLSLLAAKLCCFPLAMPRREVDQLRVRGERPEGGRLARYENLLAAIRSDDFALVSLWRDRIARSLGRRRVDALLQGVERSLEGARDSVLLASYLHADAAEAAAKLRKLKVEVSLVEVSDRSQALSYDAVPRARAGGAATLFTMGGVVVGVRGSEHLSVGGTP